MLANCAPITQPRSNMQPIDKWPRVEPEGEQAGSECYAMTL
jgi:hypothetical protein